jgi:ubiquinone/menaquinone biosynthesis C-methylase UbiE
MFLNRIEKVMMNNPIRAAIQKRFEVPRLIDMGGVMDGGRALEVGCGRGVGTELILDRFGADRVDAFDLDPDMVARAEKRLRRHDGRVRLWVGDVTKIPSPHDTYDAVFDFGIIHHVPDWRAALSEIFRVLKPGGQLYAEEILAHFIHHPIWRRLLDHPMHDRFDAETFHSALAHTGFHVIATKSLLRDAAWFIARKPLLAA